MYDFNSMWYFCLFGKYNWLNSFADRIKEFWTEKIKIWNSKLHGRAKYKKGNIVKDLSLPLVIGCHRLVEQS